MHKTLHKIPKRKFYFRRKFLKIYKIELHKIPKRKFLVTPFSKKEILFQTKNFKNWIIQNSIKGNFWITVFPKKEILPGKFQKLPNQVTQNSIKGNFQLLTS